MGPGAPIITMEDSEMNDVTVEGVALLLGLTVLFSLGVAGVAAAFQGFLKSDWRRRTW